MYGILRKNFGVESGLNYLLFIGCFAIVYFITGKYRKHLERKSMKMSFPIMINRIRSDN